MNQIFENEFLEISNGVASDIKKLGKNWGFSVLGSPLMSSKVLLVGNNWGGTDAGESQRIMPLYNDILAYPSVATYSGYLDFFLTLFNGDKLKMINYFNRIVYTNGNFIRTPNENDEYSQELDAGYKITNRYLRKIIEIIEPSIIICFGNSNRSATSAIAEALDFESEFWLLENAIIHKTSNNWSTYYFKSKVKGTTLDIYSFPHSSKYNLWKKDIELNPNFVNLKNQINDGFTKTGQYPPPGQ